MQVVAERAGPCLFVAEVRWLANGTLDLKFHHLLEARMLVEYSTLLSIVS